MKRLTLWLVMMMVCLACASALAEDAPVSWVDITKGINWDAPSCNDTVGSVSISRTGM